MKCTKYIYRHTHDPHSLTILSYQITLNYLEPMEESNIMQEQEHVNVSPPTPASSYMGVRKRKWGKFASKIRDQGRNITIWSGTYEEPQMAAAAYDTAAFHLKGRDARLNFLDMIEKLPMPVQEYKIST